VSNTEPFNNPEPGNVIAFQRIVAPRVLGRAPDEAAIAAAMPRAHRIIDELARLLGARPFFTGETLTLADALLLPQLEFLSRTPEWQPLAGAHANLRAWLERMAARPSFAATTWERVAAACSGRAVGQAG
jgi:glutathione S-transferase